MKTDIEVKNLEVIAGGQKILEDVSFRLPAGSILSIVGPNGAGKSTLLKALTRRCLPSKGEVHVLGYELEKPLRKSEVRSLRREIGQVFQGLHLISRLSVMENVLIGRLGRNKSLATWIRRFSAQDQRLAQSALELVGLLHKSHLRVDRLSGGERQKVAIARAIAQEALLLLADEPTASLDPSASVEIVNLFRKLCETHQKSLVIVVHNLELLPLLGGHVLGLKSGRTAFFEPFHALLLDQIKNLYHRKDLPNERRNDLDR